MLYWAVFVGGYLYTALKNEYRKVSDKQFVESKYAATSTSDASTADSKPKSRPSKSVAAPVPREDEDDDEDEEQNKQSTMDTKSWAEKERIEKERRDALIKSYEAVYEKEDTSSNHGKLKDEEERSTVVTASVGDSMI